MNNLINVMFEFIVKEMLDTIPHYYSGCDEK